MAVSSSLSRSISLSFSSLKRGGCGVVPRRIRIGAVARAQAEEQESSECVRAWRRRELVVGGMIVALVTVAEKGASAEEYLEEYDKDTRQVIAQVRGTIEMEKEDPNRSNAVAALRQASNEWVAKYRRDKQLAGKPSFSNMYSVLNAISGHYISFGPTAPIPIQTESQNSGRGGNGRESPRQRQIETQHNISC
ncbi:hypothetical protein KI387_034765, partial [Taxus chinensis]